MSIHVEQAIIHAITLNSEGKLGCRLRPQPLLNGAAVEAMVEELHQTYSSKAGKGFGFFGVHGDDGEANPAFKNALQSYLENALGFVELSAAAGKLLQEELSKYDFSQGGFLLLALYQHCLLYTSPSPRD